VLLVNPSLLRLLDLLALVLIVSHYTYC
jgi:hypothetical protein